MKKIVYFSSLLVLLAGIGFGFYYDIGVFAHLKERIYGTDPDMPGFLVDAAGQMTKEEFMQKRADNIAMLRGLDTIDGYNPQFRIDAIEKMEKQEAVQSVSLAAPNNWTEIGPNPIPNGQVQSGAQLPVSGRTVAIAVHPTNPDLVYVGTAQGGLYRTTDGGATWTPLLDGALSLAIGAVAIAPSQPDTIYVGTGEHNFSADSFFGVGVYRIDNASTASPTISGPFGGPQFNGRGIGKIIVSPTDPATIFVGSTSGVGGLYGTTPAVLPNRGLYRSTDATSANPTFTQIATPFANQNLSVRDLAVDPNDANILVANLVANGGGILRSTNALAAVPTLTQVATFSSTSTSGLTAEFAVIHPAGDANATFYAATGNNTVTANAGRILKSTDGGATFPQINATTFCNPQCFYNIAVAVDPTNVNNVYVGGTGANTFIRSTNGGTNFAASQANLHTDSHVIAVAPSLPSTIYFGSDGGIYRSIDSGTTWTSLNNTTFRATQFMSLDVHPTDSNFTIGGTQDNGTEYRNPAGLWFRSDFGDGGFAVIDQSAVDTTAVNLYHTYFNASNLTGYAFTPTSAATEGTWLFRGCNGGTAANGITCTGVINFYAPLERGPGTPNSIYYGADRLYRSIDTGVNHTTVSQIFASPISAIGISPQNDNVRIIGRNDGGIFGTGTTPGTTTLQDLDPTNVVPNNAVARAVIDPNNVNTAYVTLSAFNVVNVWKTTTLSSFADTGNFAPTWTAANTGLPAVPVNAFVVDPLNSNNLYAGTDIGVYISRDGGANWSPYRTGLPRVAVFDMAIQPTSRTLRIATHGRGMWEIALFPPTAANVSVAGRVTNGRGAGIGNAIVTITNNQGGKVQKRTNTFGNYSFDGVITGQTYTLEAFAKGYQFDPQVVSVEDSVQNLDFVPASGSLRKFGR